MGELVIEIVLNLVVEIEDKEGEIGGGVGEVYKFKLKYSAGEGFGVGDLDGYKVISAGGLGARPCGKLLGKCHWRNAL